MDTNLPLLRDIAREHGTPVFVYDLDDVFRRIDLIYSAFENRFKVSYAVKANPHPYLLRKLMDRVDTLDISSGGELKRAITLGWPGERLSFTGPGKRTWELKASVEHRIGEVIVESIDEARELDDIAGDAGHTQPVLMRVAPKKLPRGFGVNMAGKPSQFGIDEEAADDAIEQIRKLSNLALKGFHIYAGTQCLDVDAISENYGNFNAIFQRLANDHDLTPRKLIFGSGIGIPYHEGTEPVSFSEIAAKTNPLLDEMKRNPKLSSADCYLETGRYLIGDAGYYLTKILRIKESRGSRIGICDGGMNHHLGACGHLGSVLHRNYRMFKVSESHGDAEEQPYELVGPLCTSIDTLGHGVKFPGLKTNDIIAVRTSGAYGVTASPVYFISHDPPMEVFCETMDGAMTVTEAPQVPATPNEPAAMGAQP